LKINVSDIIWIEALKDYIRIHLTGTTKPVVTRMPLKQVEEQLAPAKFIRIHKSYIIAVAHITAIRKNSVFIGDMELPVGDNYREAVAALTGIK